ncbi:hypothetical protein BDC45DRAFT_497532 [Circinella umbellata]|nr:hypothetical protein BDC45DRAFT_497532 [Circinella umbellata]
MLVKRKGGKMITIDYIFFFLWLPKSTFIFVYKRVHFKTLISNFQSILLFYYSLFFFLYNSSYFILIRVLFTL